MKMYDMASRAAIYLVSEADMDQTKTDRVRFGLELLFGEIIKWAILLALAALLGFLPETLIAMAGFSLFRLVSGGPHCEDYWRCLVFSLLVFFGSAVLGVLAGPYVTKSMLTMAVIAGAVLMAVMVLIWAPGEVSERKIKQGERLVFKWLSLVFLALWAVVITVFVVPYSVSLAIAGFLGTVVQTFTFTPPGYQAMDGFDILLSKIIGERRYTNHAENA